MKIAVDHETRITGAPMEFLQGIQGRLTFRNPKFLENEKQGRWQGDTPEFVTCATWTPGGLVVPRGFTRQLIGMARKACLPFDLVERRRSPEHLDFTFTGKLRPFQEEAVSAVLQRDFGTLSAPTGSGKTVMALAIVAARRQPALIVVHTKELAAQWVDRIGAFLGIPASEVGMIGSGRHRIGERITVALVQSLYRCAEEVAPHVGHLIVDECHRAPSRTFTEAVAAFDCKYQLGLSATPWRRDGLSRLIFWHLSDVVHEVERGGLIEDGHLVPVEVVTRETEFQTTRDGSAEYQAVLSDLTEDPARNAMIASDVAQVARNGAGVCLVLSGGPAWDAQGPWH